MGNAITLQVRAEFLASSIQEMQKVLDNLKPNTAEYTKLKNIISTMSAEAEKLGAKLSKPLINTGDVKSAQKNVGTLEESLARASKIMENLKFSNINFSKADLASLQTFEDEITNVQTKITELQEKTKNEILAPNWAKNAVQSIDASALTKSFSEVESIIDKGYQKINQTMYDKAEQLRPAMIADIFKKGLTEFNLGEIFSEYLNNINGQLEFNTGKTSQDFLKAITSYFKLDTMALGGLIGQDAQQISDAFKSAIQNQLLSQGGLTENSLGKELFAQFFSVDNLGTAILNSGSQLNLLQAMKNGGMLDVDDATLQTWASQTYTQMVESIKSYASGKASPFSEMFTKADMTVSDDSLNKLKSDLETVKEKYSQLFQLKVAFQNVQGADTSYSQQLSNLINELDQAAVKLQQQQDQLTKNSTVMQNYKSAAQNMSSGLSNLQSALNQTNAAILQQERALRTLNSVKMTVVNFMGFTQVLNLVKRGVKDAINHIKELDSVMNKIAVVTDMSTSDLWNQVDQYSAMAQAYGVSIKGAYEVSQIYYQQGLETADVMTLTNETLKLAKISGLDYAAATDYMTTALRGFKMEMSEASTVVDVYSALAAHTAVSQEELAVAMSKTASSMQNVGSSFEESSAMIGTMVAVTRESATNIGSALKSIASRYGELTKDPTKLVDEEGEAMAFNKVDAALQSVGISMKTVDGQFRNFTDVIIELGEKWDQLDSVQQRYIATQFAGNRQQSRFLALVSNVDLLKSNINVAEESEDTGALQTLKTLDSVETKLEQITVAYQQFYTTIGAEGIWKGMLTGATNVINSLNSMDKVFGKIPVNAIIIAADFINTIKGIGVQLLTSLASVWTRIQTNAQEQGQNTATQYGEGFKTGLTSSILGIKNTAQQITDSADTSFKQMLDQKLAQAQSTVATEQPVEIPLTVDQQADAELERIRAQVEELRSSAISLNFENYTFQEAEEKFNQLKNRITEIKNSPVSFSVKQEALAQVKTQLETLRQTLAKSGEFHIKAVANNPEDTGLSKQLSALSGKSTKELKGLEQEFSIKTKVTGYQEGFNQIKANIDAISEQGIELRSGKLVGTNIAELDKLKAELESLQINPDDTQMQEKVDNLLQQIETLKTSANNIELTPVQDALKTVSSTNIKLNFEDYTIKEAREKLKELRDYAKTISESPLDIKTKTDELLKTRDLILELQQMLKDKNSQFNVNVDGTPTYAVTKGATSVATRDANEILSVNTNQIQDEVNKVKDEVSNLSELDIHVRADGIEIVKEHINEIKSSISTLQAKVELDPTAKQQLVELEAQLNILSEKVIKIPVESDLDTANQKVSEIHAAIDILNNKHLSPQVRSEGVIQLNNLIKELETEINTLNSKGVDPTTIQQYRMELDQAKTALNNFQSTSTKAVKAVTGLSSAASGLRLIASTLNDGTTAGKNLYASLTLVAGIMSTIDAIQKVIAGSNPFMAIATAAVSLITAFRNFFPSMAEQIESLNKEAEQLSNTAKEFKANEKTLDNSIKKIEELAEKRYESAEAAEEYQTAVDDLASKFPALIAGFDEAGNVILNTTNSEAVLAAARQKTAQATYEAAQAELNAARAKLTDKHADINNKISSLDTGFENEISQKRYEFLAKYLPKDYNGANSAQEGLQQVFNPTGDGISISKQAFDQLVEDYGLNSNITADNKLIDRLEIAFSELKELDATSIEGKNKLNEINSLMSEATAAGIDISSYKDSLTEVEKLIQEYDTLMATVGGYSNATISAWQNLKASNDKSLSYVSDSAGASAIVTQAINKDFEAYKELTGTVFDINDDNYNIIVKDMYQHNPQEEMKLFWNRLNDTQQELFNTMFGDSSNYSAVDFEAEFGSVTGFSDIYTYILSYYDEGITSIKDRLTEQVNSSLVRDQEGLQDFQDNFDTAISNTTTRVQESYLNTIYSQVENLANAKLTTRASDFGEAGLTMFEEINGLDADVRKSVYKKISEINLLTVEGIEEFKSWIESNDTITNKTNFTDQLDIMGETIISNIQLSLETLTSNFYDEWSDTSKHFKKLSSGIEFSEIDDIIKQAADVGFTLTADDFKADGDKYVLLSETIQKYWEAYQSASGTSLGQLSIKLEEAYGILTEIDADTNKVSLNEIDLNNEEDITALKTILGGKFDDYIKTERDENNPKKITGYTQLVRDDELWEAIQEAYEQDNASLDTLRQLRERAAQTLEKENQWKKGDYSSLADVSAATFKDKTEDEINSRLKALASTESYTTAELNEPDVKNAVTKLQSAYNSLISDIFSKEIQNINLEDYEGLITDNELNAAIDKMKSASNFKQKQQAYVEFINTYGQMAGKTVDEINDWIKSAIEEAQEQYNKDAIKDFSFIDQTHFTATLDELTDFAKLYNLKLQDLLRDGTATWSKELNEYIVDMTKVDIDWSAIDGLKETIADSINEMIQKIVSAVKNGLSGKLSNDEAKTLQTNLRNLGITDVELDFTRTAEGLQLSQEAATSLYLRLKQIDSLQATLVFKDLSENLQKNNEHYASITSTLSRINELQTEIGKGAHDKRIQQYEEELALAWEIYAVRSTTEDSSFKFMDNKIPAAQNNPLNYYENWGDAWSSLTTGVKNGYIAYQDWYNIANEMNNIAAQSGQQIEMAGVTLDGSMEAAAALIQKGAESLTVASDGSINVSLSNFGLNLTSGANSLENSVNTGIKSIADSQVEMLDSLISLLEVIVAMEELGDIDVEGNGIDLTDIFNIEYDDQHNQLNSELWSTYTTNFQNVAKKILGMADSEKELADALETVKVNGVSVKQMFEDAEDGIKELDISNEAYTAIMKSFYEAAMSGNYDLDNIFESITEVLAESGLSNDTITIDVGTATYVITGKSVIKAIDWEDDVTKKLIKEIQQETGNTEEQIKKDLTETYKDYYDGKEISIQDYEYILKLRKILTVDKDGNWSVKIGNDTYTSDSPDYQGALEAIRISDITGVDLDKNNLKINGDKATVTQEYGVTEKIKFTIEAEQGKITWSGMTEDGTTITANSQDDLLQGLWEAYKAAHPSEDSLSYEDWLYVKYGIKTITSAKITNASGDTIDISKDPQIQSELQSMIKGGINSLQKYTDKITVNGNQGTITLDTGELLNFEIKDGNIEGSLYESIQNLLGIDTMITSITAAISDAFSGEGGQKIGETIGQGIKTAFSSQVEGGITLDNPIEVVKGIANVLEITEVKDSKYTGDTLTINNNEVATLYRRVIAYITSYNDDSAPKKPEDFVNGLNAIITSYADDPSVDLSTAAFYGTLSAISALVTSYSDTGYKDNTTFFSRLQMIGALITSYSESGLISTSGLTVFQKLMDITGKLTKYSEEGTPTLDTPSLAALKGYITTFLQSPSGATFDYSTALINTLTGYITSYISQPARGKDPNSFISNLQGIITVYKDVTGGADITQAIVYSSLKGIEALISSYTDGEEVTDPQLMTDLQAIQAYITSYADQNATTSGATIYNSLSNLIGKIIKYDEKGKPTVNKSSIEALTAIIKTYEDDPTGVTKPTLDELTQIISDIDTEGADAALERWRTLQESKKIKVAVETEEESNENSIRTNLFRQAYSTSRDYGRFSNKEWTEIAASYGLTANENNQYSLSTGEINNYLTSLESVLATGQTLSKVDLTNLQALHDSGQIDTESYDRLGQLLTDNEMNAEDLSSTLANLSSLVNVNPENIANLATNMSMLADAAERLAKVDYSTLIEQLSQINIPSTGGGSGGESEEDNTPAVGLQNMPNFKGIIGYGPQDTTLEVNKVTGAGADELAVLAAGKAEVEVETVEAPATPTTPTTTTATSITTTEPTTTSTELELNTEEATEQLEEFTDEVTSKTPILIIKADDSQARTITGQLFSDTEDSIVEYTLKSHNEGAEELISQMRTDLSSIATDWEANVKVDDSAIQNAQKQLKALQTRYSASVSVSVTVDTSGVPDSITIPVSTTTPQNATGNIGLAKGTSTIAASGSLKPLTHGVIDFRGGYVHGGARAAGTTSTLMGELGPELVVQGGRYFVAGQNGAEFVDLHKDAIVFNHLQTESLLNKGMSSTRGKAVTNERAAVAYAKGSVDGGPAMSSASAALATLKQLRSMWASLASASVADLAGAGGSGGGGGSSSSLKSYVSDVEKWYNWLQKIEALEKSITYEEEKRSRISSEWGGNGREYVTSLQQSLEDYKREIQTQASLQQTQQEYFDKRRKELNSSSYSFSQFYTFDETGQLRYQEGAAEKLARLKETNEYGTPVMTAEEQYNAILAMNPDFANYMKYDSSGTEIDLTSDGGYATAVQAFFDKMDADKEEMQTLYDSINDAKQQQEELAQKRNELLAEMRDNQMELENKVYSAIVDTRQREIDELQETRDAIEESNNKLIDGLTNALNKEREMYENQDSRDDLSKSRRQLDILRRAGGSQTEISSLQEEIADKEREDYFTAQQEQIDAIQEASDKQLEKLDAQINLMTETLEYQKKYGLLWGEVSDIMQRSPEEIANYIATNNSEYWDKSPLAKEDTMKQLIFSSEEWAQYRDSIIGSDDGSLKAILESINEHSAAAADSSGGGSGDSSGGSSGGDSSSEGGNSSGGSSSGQPSAEEEETGTGSIIITCVTEGGESLGRVTVRKKKGTYKWKTVAPSKTGYTAVSGSPEKVTIVVNGTTPLTVTYRTASAGETPHSGAHGNQEYTGAADRTITSTDTTWTSDDNYHWHIRHYSNGTTDEVDKAKHTFVQASANTFSTIYVCNTCGRSKSVAKSSKENINSGLKDSKKSGIQQFSSGGLDEETGLAILHGTKSEPEAVLNAEQTAILRNKILGGGNKSLLNMLGSLQSTWAETANSQTYSSISRDKSVTFDGTNINMNFNKVANDYDARRAGNEAMSEMLRIARKTAVTSLGR